MRRIRDEIFHIHPYALFLYGFMAGFTAAALLRLAVTFIVREVL